jgi:hypothetical protein
MSSIYLELAIGVALAFFALSLLVSAVQEGVTRLLGIRAKFLWAYLRDQFGDGLAENGNQSGGAGADNGHSLLPATALQFVKLGGVDTRPVFDSKPARPAIHSGERTTADGLYQRLRLIDYRALKFAQKSRTGRSSIDNIPTSRFATALIGLASAAESSAAESSAGKSSAGKSSAAESISEWLQALEYKESPLYRPMKTAWDGADQDLQKFALAIEHWFDGEMVRLSGLYRKHLRWVIAVIAVLITLFTGFDSLAYARAVVADSAFRSQAVAVATGNPDKLEKLQHICQAHEREASVVEQPASDPYACVSDVFSSPSFARILGDAVVSAHLFAADGPLFRWNGPQWWARISQPAHWPGFLLTVVALLFGASFWWDILRRLAGVRSSQSMGNVQRS